MGFVFNVDLPLNTLFAAGQVRPKLKGLGEGRWTPRHKTKEGGRGLRGSFTSGRSKEKRLKRPKIKEISAPSISIYFRV